MLARGLTFVLLFFGTLLPVLLDAQDPKASQDGRVFQLQLGVAALAAAGLLQVADKVFGWSSGWVRYITTVTPLEYLSTIFEIDWNGYKLERQDEFNRSDITLMYGLAKKYVTDALDLQKDETEKWVAEFDSGTAVLADAIRISRQTAETAVVAGKTTMQSKTQTGAIQLTISRSTTTDEIAVSLDGGTSEPVVGTSWVATNVAIGVRSVAVLNLSDKAKTVRRALIVLPNAITSDVLKL